MTGTTDEGLTATLGELPGLVGRHLGFTDWATMEQARVDLFADATDDHQFIHVDPERAARSPFGGTIAHGYLTLSLVAAALHRLLTVTDSAMVVNYGLDRVRFPAPLPVGRRWRAGAELSAVDQASGGLQLKLRITVEVEGSPRPAMVADVLVRLYG